MVCNCEVCQRHRKNKEIIKRADPKEMAELIEQQEDAIMHLETDYAHYGMILHGTWPRAVCILERALEKAKKGI